MPVISASFPLKLDVHLQPSRARLRALDWRGRVVREEQRPCAPGTGATPWSASVEAARALLAAPGRMRGRRARVALSDAFVHYGVIPATAGVAGDAERAAYARHLFRAEYGAAVERWRVALDVDARGTTLACMVEPGLVEDVTALGAATGFLPVSLRPHFACAQSALAARLGRADGWIAVLEDGYCTLALRQGGTWRDLAGTRVPEGGPDGAFFAAAIGARAWAVEAAGPVRTLHLIGWHGPAAAPRPGPEWQVHAWPDPHGFVPSRREAPLAA